MTLRDSDLIGNFTPKLLMVYNNIKNDTSTASQCLLYEVARCIM